MQKGDYIDLCFVHYYPADIKHDFFIAPPWTVHVGDTVKLSDGSAGTVAVVQTVPFDSEQYHVLLTVSGTEHPERIKGIIRYEEIDWKSLDAEIEEQEAQPA